MDANKSSISQADSYEAMGAFWDEADLTEWDDPERVDVVFDVREGVRIEAALLVVLEKIAGARGISTETLVNLWLQEKVQTVLPVEQ